ncbi:MAG: hypothetical protein U1E27_06905, partial [Kiritimatiellia bacterium]|nr:hypothetical protein [Kiritimatiellia bacterium]
KGLAGLTAPQPGSLGRGRVHLKKLPLRYSSGLRSAIKRLAENTSIIRMIAKILNIDIFFFAMGQI